MFQVVVQSAIRLLKSKKFRLPAPPANTSEDKKYESKDKTELILILIMGGGLLLMAMFSNLPSN